MCFFNSILFKDFLIIFFQSSTSLNKNAKKDSHQRKIVTLQIFNSSKLVKKYDQCCTKWRFNWYVLNKV